MLNEDNLEEKIIQYGLKMIINEFNQAIDKIVDDPEVKAKIKVMAGLGIMKSLMEMLTNPEAMLKKIDEEEAQKGGSAGGGSLFDSLGSWVNGKF